MQSIYPYSKKVLFSLVFVIMALVTIAQQQQISYSDSWNVHGVQLITEDHQRVILNVSVNEFLFNEKMIDREVMNAVSLKDVFLQGDEGSPDLPIYSKYIALPQGAKAKVRVLKKRTISYHNVEIAPAPRIPLDTDLGPLHYEKNKTVYSKDGNYPSNIVIVSDE